MALKRRGKGNSHTHPEWIRGTEEVTYPAQQVKEQTRARTMMQETAVATIPITSLFISTCHNNTKNQEMQIRRKGGHVPQLCQGRPPCRKDPVFPADLHNLNGKRPCSLTQDSPSTDQKCPAKQDQPLKTATRNKRNQRNKKSNTK